MTVQQEARFQRAAGRGGADLDPVAVMGNAVQPARLPVDRDLSHLRVRYAERFDQVFEGLSALEGQRERDVSLVAGEEAVQFRMEIKIRHAHLLSYKFITSGEKMQLPIDKSIKHTYNDFIRADEFTLASGMEQAVILIRKGGARDDTNRIISG